MTEKISPDMQKQIMEFQQAQQQARLVMSQKYQMELQLKELDSALSELDKSGKTEIHKVIGQILIKSDKDSVEKELKEKKETLEVRLKSIEAQEKKLTTTLKSLQDRLQGVIPSAPKSEEEEKE